MQPVHTVINSPSSLSSLRECTQEDVYKHLPSQLVNPRGGNIHSTPFLDMDVPKIVSFLGPWCDFSGEAIYGAKKETKHRKLTLKFFMRRCSPGQKLERRQPPCRKLGPSDLFPGTLQFLWTGKSSFSNRALVKAIVWGSKMPSKIVLLEPQNWSWAKPYH